MLTGKCLCGEVTLSVAPQSQQVSACHCGMCQTWNGGPGLTLDCGSDVQIEGADSVQAYASSPWADRAFCRTCGTHLFYFLKPKSTYYVAAGLFKENQDFALASQIYIDCKPAYYHFADKTANYTEQDILQLLQQGAAQN